MVVIVDGIARPSVAGEMGDRLLIVGVRKDMVVLRSACRRAASEIGGVGTSSPYGPSRRSRAYGFPEWWLIAMRKRPGKGCRKESVVWLK